MFLPGKLVLLHVLGSTISAGPLPVATSFSRPTAVTGRTEGRHTFILLSFGHVGSALHLSSILLGRLKGA
jgi:hypothetical protein